MATTSKNDDGSTDYGTNEKKVLAALEAADEPLSLSDLDDELDDVSYKSISATLSDLKNDDFVDRRGKGGPHDPYRYVHTNGGGLDALFVDEDVADADLSDLFEGDREESATKKTQIFEVLRDADEFLTVGEITKRLPDVSKSSVSSMTSSMYEDGQIDRVGFGKKGDPYRYMPHSTVEDREDDGYEYDYEMLPNSATEDDVEFGKRYRVRVNNTEPYGVFVSFTKHEDYTDEVTGLAHKNHMPNLRTPSDFHTDDQIGVMLIERGDKGLEVETVAAFDTIRGKPFEVDPHFAPTEPPTTDEDDEPEPEPEPDDEPEPTPDDGAKTSREVALEYVDHAGPDALKELWEAAGVLPAADTPSKTEREVVVDYLQDADHAARTDVFRDAEVPPFDGSVVALEGPSDWVDIIFAIGDCHLSVDRTRFLLQTVCEQVWGDGSAKIDVEDRED